MEQWVIILGGVSILVGGALTAYPGFSPQWIGFVVIAIGVFTIAYGVWGATRPRPAYYGVPIPSVWVWDWKIRFRRLLPLRRLIPLRRAAGLAYEKTRGLTVAGVAEASEGGQEGILGYYAYALTGGNGIPLYGKKVPSTKIEMIRATNMSQFHFVEQLSAVAYHGQPEPQYKDLMVEKGDLRRQIKKIKEWMV